MQPFEKDNDLIQIIDESDNLSIEQALPPWKILIVDDDEDVHNVTKYAVNEDTEILGRKLLFLSAYSAAEAEQLLASEFDIALILLDCVMETETAGLDLVDKIRSHLQLKDTRIVLRTGQPGYAPESQVIANYDINDYHSKADLASRRLVTTITAAIRSYQQLRLLYSSGILFQKIIAATTDLMNQQNLEQFCERVAFHLNSFFSSNVELLVAARNDNTSPRILAASSKFQDLVNSAVSDMENTPAGELINLALNNRQNIFTGKEGALFFDGGNTQIVAYVASPADFIDFEQNLLFLLSHNIGMAASNLR